MCGLSDERREGGARGVSGISPRSEELDDLRPRAGEDERFRLATLGLRRGELDRTPGDDGTLCSSDGRRGELRAGDCGSGVFAAVCSDRRLSEWERRFASLFVDCRAALGAPLLASGGAAYPLLCMLAVRPAWRRARVCAVKMSWVLAMGVRKFAMTARRCTPVCC